MRAATWTLLGLLVVTGLGWYTTWQAKSELEARLRTAEKVEREVATLRARLTEMETAPRPASVDAGDAPGLRGQGDAAAVTAAERQRERARREEVRQKALAEHRRQQQENQEALGLIKKKILQIRNPTLREEGLQALTVLLAGDDPQRTRGALQALIEARDTKLDPDRFRPLILEQISAEDPGVRRTALYALYNVAREDGDISYALSAVDDPSDQVRHSASHLIKMYSEGTIEGDAADGILRLLSQENSRARKEAMRGIWGAKVTQAIQTRLLEIAQSPAERHDAVYFGLSTLNNKSREVVTYLIDALADPNPNVSHRARWGLGYGIPEEDHTFFADALAEKLDLLADRETQLQMIRLIERHGNADQVDRLQTVADNELASESVRQAAEHAIQRLAGR